MKRTVLLSFALLLGTLVFAQINPHALGLRFGGGSSANAEISYQRGLGDNNRLEVDLGLGNNNYYSRFALSGIYQWVWTIESGFSWYAGVGGQLGSVSWDNSRNNDGFWLSVNGQVGIEYQFSEIPLQVSLDTRPGIAVINGGDGFDLWDIAFSVRYVF